MSELNIPDAAFEAGETAYDEAHLHEPGYVPPGPDEIVEAVVRAAGPALVAAELRRIADEVADQVKAMTGFPTLEAEADALTGVMRTLRARADELDPNGDHR